MTFTIVGTSAEESESADVPEDDAQEGTSPDRPGEGRGTSPASAWHESADTKSPDTATLLRQAREADVLSKCSIQWATLNSGPG